jgi:hypothetical protein
VLHAAPKLELGLREKNAADPNQHALFNKQYSLSQTQHTLSPTKLTHSQNNKGTLISKTIIILKNKYYLITIAPKSFSSRVVKVELELAWVVSHVDRF